MQYTTLGRTGLQVSVAGLGCGGNSLLGKARGASPAESVALVEAALDLGVTFIDTAEAYATEDIVGAAIAGRARQSVVVSTKGHVQAGGTNRTAAQIIAALETSLRNLKTDYVDVYNLHGVHPSRYDHCLAELLPALLKAKAAGKIRHVGITENSPGDPAQAMLQRAVKESDGGRPVWEVVMLAYHLMNQGARRDLLPHTRANGVGTLLMFVVRNIFSQPGVLAEAMRDLAAKGQVPAELGSQENPLDFLVHAGGGLSLQDAAYRFVRHEPGVDVVLFGTGSVAHLKTNIASILSPPLPVADIERLYQLFGHLRGVGLDLPDRMTKKA